MRISTTGQCRSVKRALDVDQAVVWIFAVGATHAKALKAVQHGLVTGCRDGKDGPFRVRTSKYGGSVERTANVQQFGLWKFTVRRPGEAVKYLLVARGID